MTRLVVYTGIDWRLFPSNWSPIQDFTCPPSMVSGKKQKSFQKQIPQNRVDEK